MLVPDFKFLYFYIMATFVYCSEKFLYVRLFHVQGGLYSQDFILLSVRVPPATILRF